MQRAIQIHCNFFPRVYSMEYQLSYMLDESEIGVEETVYHVIVKRIAEKNFELEADLC